MNEYHGVGFTRVQMFLHDLPLSFTDFILIFSSSAASSFGEPLFKWVTCTHTYKKVSYMAPRFATRSISVRQIGQKKTTKNKEKRFPNCAPSGKCKLHWVKSSELGGKRVRIGLGQAKPEGQLRIGYTYTTRLHMCARV